MPRPKHLHPDSKRKNYWLEPVDMDALVWLQQHLGLKDASATVRAAIRFAHDRQCGACAEAEGLDPVELEPKRSIPEERSPAAEAAFESKTLETRCIVCGEQQITTPGGDSCPNGHGGAAGYLLDEPPSNGLWCTVCGDAQFFWHERRKGRVTGRKLTSCGEDHDNAPGTDDRPPDDERRAYINEEWLAYDDPAEKAIIDAYEQVQRSDSVTVADVEGDPEDREYDSFGDDWADDYDDDEARVGDEDELP